MAKYKHSHKHSSCAITSFIRIYLAFLCLLLFCKFVSSIEYRSIDGTGNNKLFPTAGATNDKYLRVDLPNANFVDGNRQPLKTPTDGVLPGTAVKASCTDQLAADVFPLPRCVSNIVTRYGTNLIINDNKTPIYKSVRKTSHMITFFGQYISYDTSAAVEYPDEPTYIYAPLDDANYNPPGSPPANIMTAGPDLVAYPNNGVLRQNRSQFDPANPAQGGVNGVTGFLDLSPLYGPTAAALDIVRDRASQRGKLLMVNGYSPWNDTTRLFKLGGQFARSQNIFTLAINTVFLREHNRLCDWLYTIYTTTWNDEQYFQEARRWNIGQYQKIVSEEYLGVVTGRPLPPYTAYNPNERPGTDVFFNAIALRYGHSEISDSYNILNINGETLAELPLSQTVRLDLLLRVGLASILRSMASQRQEEVDAYVSDETRAWTGVNKLKYEVAAFDVSRGRDLGIPLYNDARAGFNLTRKKSFAEVTSNAEIAARLQAAYGTVDKCEAFACAHAEDHIEGANVGELVYTALVRQFDRYRVTDRFWFQNYFSAEEQQTFRKRTFRDVIIDNLTPDELPQDITFPGSIWTVLPPVDNTVTNAPNPTATGITDPYPGDMTRWPEYKVRFGIKDKTLQFSIAFATENGNGWFGIGFGPSDDGMTNADFIIGRVSSGSASLGNYISKGYQPPVLDSDHHDFALTSTTLNGTVYNIEFSRPTAAASPGRTEIAEGQMKVIMAFNPTTDVVTYHGSRNRVRQIIDFTLGKVVNIQDAAVAASPERQRQTRLAHGIGMAIVWCIIFPVSIYVIRYYKHTTFYLKFHKNMQLFGVLLVGTFGAAAIATIANIQTNHAKIGLAVYIATFFQMLFGLTTYWSLQKSESVNEGLLRIVKRIHRYFGILLVITAWFSLYLGINVYCLTYGVDRVPWHAALVGCVALICLIFASGQLWNFMGGKCKLKACGTEAEEKTVDVFFDGARLTMTPDFTWDQVNEGVQRGAFLVVCDGYVADIRRWIHSHPGGEKILHRVIGTDITNDFYNIHKITSSPKEEIDPDPAKDNNDRMAYSKGAHLVSPVLGNYPHLWAQQALDPEQNLRRRKTMSAKIDDFNIRRFHKSSEPIARHKHTNFAVMQFASMVIGKIKGDSYDERNVDASPTPTTYEQSYFRPHQQPYSDADLKKDTSARVFKRYQLVEKALVNGDPEHPVIKFTFIKLHQLKAPKGDRILPGDYIEIQARVKGQVVVRAYTPVEGRISHKFSIVVKIYEHGLMSQHLAHQRIGYELKVRGPFDLSDRGGVTHMTQNELSTILGRRFSTTHSVRSNLSSESNTTGKTVHLLLNPNNFDRCWDQLVMIAGGSGITPMLQLINYHLNALVHNRDRHISMHLLFANRRVEDIIMGLQLDSMMAHSQGALTVTYMVSNPPTIGAEWEGLRGHIGTSVLQTWLSHHGMGTYANSPVVQPDGSDSPTLRDDELSGHYDRLDSSKLTNSGQYDMSDQPDLTNHEMVSNYDVAQEVITTDTAFQSKGSTSSQSSDSMRPLPRIPTRQPSYAYGGIGRVPSRGTSYNYLKIQKKVVACGPPAMLDKVGASLKEMGYSDDDYILLY